MDFLQPFVAIIFVLALLGGALYVLKKRGAASFHIPGSGTSQMEVIGRVALGPQHALHLVRVGEKQIVVATGPGSSSFREVS